jgi:hypothetical protein
MANIPRLRAVLMHDTTCLDTALSRGILAIYHGYGLFLCMTQRAWIQPLAVVYWPWYIGKIIVLSYPWYTVSFTTDFSQSAFKARTTQFITQYGCTYIDVQVPQQTHQSCYMSMGTLGFSIFSSWFSVSIQFCWQACECWRHSSKTVTFLYFVH